MSYYLLTLLFTYVIIYLHYLLTLFMHYLLALFMHYLLVLFICVIDLRYFSDIQCSKGKEDALQKDSCPDEDDSRKVKKLKKNYR